MRTPVSRTLFTYWNEIRQKRIAPKRFEIEPSRIAGMLPDTYILEKIDAVTARFRLAGTRVTDAFGFEFRGTNIYDIFDEADRTTMQRQISVISRQGAVGEFVLQGTTADGEIAIFEMIVLPLTHTRDVVDRFVGCIIPMKPPAWLGSTPIVNIRLAASELIWPDGRPHAMIDHLTRQAPLAAHTREARIVRSDRRQFRVYEGGLSQPLEKE